MTKNELIFQIALVGVGGVVGTVSALVANFLNQRTQNKREDEISSRTRKENLARDLFVLVAWIAKQRDVIIEEGSAYDVDNPLLNVRVIIHLHFSSLIKDVEDLEIMVNNIQTECLEIYMGRLKGTMENDRFESLVPKTNALEKKVDQMVEKLKAIPTKA